MQHQFMCLLEIEYMLARVMFPRRCGSHVCSFDENGEFISMGSHVNLVSGGVSGQGVQSAVYSAGCGLWVGRRLVRVGGACVLTLYAGAAGTIAEFGTMQLEFEYLSDVSGNPKYRELVLKIRDTMDKYKVRGLSVCSRQVFFPVRHSWGS
jgi:hypothetical protein